jgi:hypothetical protein
MFSIQQQAAKLHFTSRTDKQGNARVPAATLRLSFKAPNDILSEFSPDLKASLYRRPHPGEGDMADEADARMDDPTYLPRLKFPNMRNDIRVDTKVVGAEVTVHYGTGGPSDIVLDDCKIDDFVFDPQDGGTVDISFNVACHPSEQQFGKLCMMQDQEIVVTITPPDDGQGSLGV